MCDCGKFPIQVMKVEARIPLVSEQGMQGVHSAF